MSTLTVITIANIRYVPTADLFARGKSLLQIATTCVKKKFQASYV
ncbi:unnamed protein product [Photorhabdus laumondii subsp. laumondii TTO1]|uniref:Photorhabdus luminescens subsp. laumondii TTO1 complete genome segment 1/17 n=1 Tax=Photorhabdus laumondii subsp. laumondii (strain DSM 15139 / CIP 105565 / TT01) TaxID=243265 RepID=Q7NA18_PHOLL|nr:unnamed protein product [Photorhabdus laumondii subsp. laumondii TTO1]